LRTEAHENSWKFPNMYDWRTKNGV
jgi:hypothetical protein